MKYILLVVLLMTTVLTFGCSAKARYRTLSFFFDGVPDPSAGVKTEQGIKNIRVEETDTNKPIQYREHGPYAARMCGGCHVPGTNNLVLPKQKLCFKCHRLNLSKKYVHGPGAAGGCTICHSPHGSAYPYYLVSPSKDFCLYCHKKSDILKNEVHQSIGDTGCTVCHDAHSSNIKYMLK
jgi:predicted CXXCH cytochrome family protein